MNKDEKRAFYADQAEGIRKVIADIDARGGVSRYYRASLLEAEAEAWDCAGGKLSRIYAERARKRAKALRQFREKE